MVTPVKLPVQNWFERRVMPHGLRYTQDACRLNLVQVRDTFVQVVCNLIYFFLGLFLGFVEQRFEIGDFVSGARLTNLIGSQFLLPSSWLRSGVAT